MYHISKTFLPSVPHDSVRIAIIGDIGHKTFENYFFKERPGGKRGTVVVYSTMNAIAREGVLSVSKNEHRAAPHKPRKVMADRTRFAGLVPVGFVQAWKKLRMLGISQ